MADKLQTVNADFGPDVQAEIEHYIHEQLESLEQAYRDLHVNKIPRWRKSYLGIPAEATRNFPFPNAANTIVQVIGETVDTMAARVMGLLWATHPAWVYENFKKFAPQDIKAKKNAEDERRVLEDYMDIAGYEPTMLDLYPVEALWFTDASKLGTAFVKATYDHITENVVTGYDESSSKRIKGDEVTVFDGPRVVNLRHEDVLADVNAQRLEDTNFVSVRHPLKRFELEERKFRGLYDKKVVEEILDHPDRTTPREQTRDENQQQGVAAPNRPDTTAEWDIFECYFGWWFKGRKFRLIYTYHKKSKKVLRKVFNFLPNNRLPVLRAKLGYRTNGLLGHGYAELLETYQEELSTQHNQRLDNGTVANIRALRVSPRARALDSNMELYPGALLVAEKDEIESIQVGDINASAFKNEEATLALVARRAGITPAVSGSGTGGMMKKPAVYSAQGTLAVMQENNSVVGFATAEFRHAHVQLGSLLTGMYAKFGTAGKEEMFGLDAERLQAALRDFAEDRMRIPIRSSSGSLNKEVEKQTGVIMAGVLQRHFTAEGQLMQAISNPIVQPQQRDYFLRVIQAMDAFTKRILKDFGYEQPDIYVPEAIIEQQAQGQVQGGNVAPGQPPVEGAGQSASGGPEGLVPRDSMAEAVSGIAPFAGAGPK